MLILKFRVTFIFGDMEEVCFVNLFVNITNVMMGAFLPFMNLDVEESSCFCSRLGNKVRYYIIMKRHLDLLDGFTKAANCIKFISFH
jgi:hypothetical protein